MVCKNQYGVPVRELWSDHPNGFNRGLFAMLKGFMDESKDRTGDLFTLSCLISHGDIWSALESEWIACLDDKNKELKKAGRKTLSRFHASDCSTRNGEFRGWSTPEQIEFTKALLAIVNRHSFNVHSYGLHLGELVEEIPEVAPNREGFAYVIILSFILLDIADTTLAKNSGELLRLFHDHCDYDAPLVEAFNHMIEDPDMKHRHKFISLAPERWQYCIPLQPADLIAYENLKDLERVYEERDRRKSLKSLLADGHLGGDAVRFHRPSLKVIRKIFDDMDDYSKEILLSNARVKANGRGV